MSTILKALRRLEQDKAVETDRPLQAAVVEPADPVAAATGRGRWVAGVLAAGAMGAGLVLLLQWEGREPAPVVSSAPPPSVIVSVAPSPPAAPAPAVAAPEPPPDVASAEESAVPAGPETPEAPLELGDEAPSSPPPVATAPEVASAPAVMLPPESQAPDLGAPVAVAPPPPAAPVEVAPPMEKTPARVTRLEPRPSAPKAALPGRAAPASEAGAVVAQPVTRSGDDPSAGEEVRTVEPTHRRVARAVSPAAPGVAVLRTVWHPKPERRTAWLESPGEAAPREYREGDHLGTLTLLRIEPSGVVFERDGVEISEKITAKP